LVANGDWHALLGQENSQLSSLERQRGNWTCPQACAYALLGLGYSKLRVNRSADHLACFGWHCLALKQH